jgi:hypothetical protein
MGKAKKAASEDNLIEVKIYTTMQVFPKSKTPKSSTKQRQQHFSAGFL